MVAGYKDVIHKMVGNSITTMPWLDIDERVSLASETWTYRRTTRITRQFLSMDTQSMSKYFWTYVNQRTTGPIDILFFAAPSTPFMPRKLVGSRHEFEGTPNCPFLGTIAPTPPSKTTLGTSAVPAQVDVHTGTTLATLTTLPTDLRSTRLPPEKSAS